MPCIKKYPESQALVDDHRFEIRPHYVGNKILLCGPKNSSFPFQCFVGPDWYCMLITYALILVPSILFTIYIADAISVALTVLSIISLAVLLACYSYAACSDPGIIYKDADLSLSDPEAEGMAARHRYGNVAVIECSQCKMMRPCTAMHCYECGVCIDDLDHHCPWTGKCIGKKTLQAFYFFLFFLTTHILYVGGVSLYYISFH